MNLRLFVQTCIVYSLREQLEMSQAVFHALCAVYLKGKTTKSFQQGDPALLCSARENASRRDHIHQPRLCALIIRLFSSLHSTHNPLRPKCKSRVPWLDSGVSVLLPVIKLVALRMCSTAFKMSCSVTLSFFLLQPSEVGRRSFSVSSPAHVSISNQQMRSQRSV